MDIRRHISMRVLAALIAIALLLVGLPVRTSAPLHADGFEVADNLGPLDAGPQPLLLPARDVLLSCAAVGLVVEPARLDPRDIPWTLALLAVAPQRPPPGLS